MNWIEREICLYDNSPAFFKKLREELWDVATAVQSSKLVEATKCEIAINTPEQWRLNINHRPTRETYIETSTTLTLNIQKGVLQVEQEGRRQEGAAIGNHFETIRRSSLSAAT